jgi:hypothetical protein
VTQAAEFLQVSTTGHGFVRIGAQHDGGYVIAGDLHHPWCLSLGVGAENSADVALAASGTVVYEFDHTVARPPILHKNIYFERVGLGESSDGTLLPLEKLVEKCGSTADDGLLMIDIEGAEWEMLSHQDPNGGNRTIDRFSQICIELHDLDRLAMSDGADFVRALGFLVHNHVPVVVHENNYAPVLNSSGRTLPTVVEVTLIRSDCLIPGDQLPPASLTHPNDPLRSDSGFVAFQVRETTVEVA